MKKRVICMLMAAMMVMSMAACNKKVTDPNNATTAPTTAVNTAYAIVDYKDYVTVGNYKDMEVAVDRSVLEVTEDEIQSEIDETLYYYSSENHITEGEVKVGDTINLDFSGLLDGVAFANGTATDVQYIVGGGYDDYGQYMKYIDDLDNGLVGLTLGKEYEIPCKFPDNYGEENLNGKDVVFVVTVNYIIEKITPEFNDDFVKMVAQDNESDMATTDDLVKEIKEYLVSMKQESFNAAKYSMVMEQLMESSEVKSYPEEEINYLMDTVRTNIQSQFEAYGEYYQSPDVESFYKENLAPYYEYETLEEFVTGYSQEFLKEKMIVTLVAKQEGLEVTEEEVKKYGDDLAVNNGFENFEAVVAEIGEAAREEIRYTLVQQKVTDYFVENIKEIQ